MPVYEYRCPQCRRKSAVFVRGSASAGEPACEHCGSQGLTRLFSTFAVRRSQSSSDDSGGADMGGFDESDPRAMAQMMRQMGGEMRDEMGPEFDQMVDQMEAGEMPDDFGGGDDEFGGDFGGDFDD